MLLCCGYKIISGMVANRIEKNSRERTKGVPKTQKYK